MITRFVMIGHPDFNLPGSEGVEAASEWVKELNQMINQMAKDVQNQDITDEQKKDAVETIKAHRVIVRKGDY